MHKIILSDYSEKGFVLRGDTVHFKNSLRKLGGKWNKNLKGGKGWVFSKKFRLEKVRKYLKYLPIIFIDEIDTDFVVVNEERGYRRECSDSDSQSVQSIDVVPNNDDLPVTSDDDLNGTSDVDLNIPSDNDFIDQSNDGFEFHTYIEYVLILLMFITLFPVSIFFICNMQGISQLSLGMILLLTTGFDVILTKLLWEFRPNCVDDFVSNIHTYDEVPVITDDFSQVCMVRG